MDRGHLGYDYSEWESVPYFADHFLTWGEAWYRDTALPRHCKIHQVGAPHIELPLRQARQECEREERRLLVLSQGPAGERLMDEVVAFARLRADWDIVVRPHPSESVDSLRLCLERLDEKVAERIDVDNSTILARASSQASVVLGVNSTALVECLLAGCKVALLRMPNTAAYFQPLVDDGDVWAVSGGEELARCIDNLPEGSARHYFGEPVEDVAALVEN